MFLPSACACKPRHELTRCNVHKHRVMHYLPWDQGNGEPRTSNLAVEANQWTQRRRAERIEAARKVCNATLLQQMLRACVIP